MPHSAVFGSNCKTNGNADTDVSIHKVPSDNKRRRELEDAQRPEEPRLYSLHFVPVAFQAFNQPPNEPTGADGDKRRLRDNAVPTVFPHNYSKRPREAMVKRSHKSLRKETVDGIMLLCKLPDAAARMYEAVWDPADVHRRITLDHNYADVQQQLLAIKEEVSPDLDLQDPELLHIKEEQEELLTSHEERFPFAVVQVKSEGDEEKPPLSQLQLRQTEDEKETEPSTSSSAPQMKTEADEEEPARNPNPNGTNKKSSDSSETEVSNDDEDDDEGDGWQNPLSDCELENGDSVRVKTNAPESGERRDVGSHAVRKPFMCSECGKQFLYKQSLQRHLTRQIKSNKRSSSSLVNKKCTGIYQNVDLQTRVHTEEKPFVCDVCGQRFNQKANLKTHTRVHTGEKPFHCEVCGERFGHHHSFKTHMRVHTGEKPFHCDVCGERFRHQYNFKTHMRVHTGEKPFGCDVCGQRFNRNTLLKTHMRVHTGEKPFGCDVCGQRFYRNTHLKTHMSVHTGEKPFNCNVCGQRFNRKGGLKTHMRVHTGEQPFGCDVCGKRFKRKGGLNAHTRVHTGEKPFCCSICEERFRHQSNLIRHRRLHTGEKPFSCSVCGKTFNQKIHFKRHLRVHTGEEVSANTVDEEDDQQDTDSQQDAESRNFEENVEIKHLSVHQAPDIVVNQISDVQQLLVIKEEVPSNLSPSLEQQGPGPVHIKEEQEEVLSSQEQEQLHVLEEADVTRFKDSAVKSESDQDKPPSSQLNQSQTGDTAETETPTNIWTERMKSERGGEDVGAREPARNSNPNTHFQPHADETSTETEGSDEDDWQEPVSDSGPENQHSDDDLWEPESSLNSQKSQKNKLSLQRCLVNKNGFRFKKNVDSQMNVQTEEKRLGCDLCGQRFNQSCHLKAHKRLHTGEKPFGCDVCGQRFTRNTHLKTHMRVHTGEKPFSCNVCEKSFGHHYNLSRHMIVHTGEKPFACDVCKLRFTNQGSLRTHTRVHTGEKPFGCTVCGERFNRNGNLKIHMRLHVGEKLFGCDVCAKKFTQQGNLKRHMRVHSTEKPFGCDVCGYRFVKESNLKTHMRVHTLKKTFDCGEIFP